ncbi:FAD-dependent oxidoreductase [Pseudoalteromonas sp. NBT06-2]|uniref:glycerol-3-phosphate dehydrogenase/oxidase n=1 Tax=Pseudoalteromonas sp. NBT06-2 TaxID=2025950 RepID=UPI000BA639C7|nr:FAD-dependent oxidoreductase [Pseudoalteromonas sp. NBT06-2]PAJ74963.1 FAD-dependent oxidoreductase [Pseudoalteromonas sp. NBT06-2]
MTQFDVTIIGGGIAGAGVAQCAAAAGYRVLLLEKGDYASQTSCSSSKLIHGGLRYLETMQLNLVYNALHERTSLLRLAPELVKPVPFYIPLYKDSSRSVWTLRAGLSLYALLSGFTKLSRYKELPKKSWSVIQGLKTDGLIAVFQYWDAQTNDQLLTNSVINSAIDLGAKAQSYAEFIKAEKLSSGYKVTYRLNKDICEINTKMIINATGPWVNETLNKIYPQIKGCNIDWVQGTHVILDKTAPKKIFYLEVKTDQRVIFVMPWYGKTLIGTTEVLLQELPEYISPHAEEIDYLLSAYQSYYKGELPKIIRSFAGIRVLPKHSDTAFSRPRESIIWQDQNNPNIISLYGGKLTTFRMAAKKVVKKVKKQIGAKKIRANIDSIKL